MKQENIQLIINNNYETEQSSFAKSLNQESIDQDVDIIHCYDCEFGRKHTGYTDYICNNHKPKKGNKITIKMLNELFGELNG